MHQKNLSGLHYNRLCKSSSGGSLLEKRLCQHAAREAWNPYAKSTSRNVTFACSDLLVPLMRQPILLSLLRRSWFGEASSMSLHDFRIVGLRWSLPLAQES